MNDKKVVYLFGAGATHGCLSFAGSSVGLLMRHLNPALLKRLRLHIRAELPHHQGLEKLVFGVLDDNTDYEHVLTFLEQSPSSVHRALAIKAREIFRSVLSEQIARAIDLQGGRVPNDLYLALLDLHAVRGYPEKLSGMITLNYDGFLESAVVLADRHHIEWCMAVADGESASLGRETLPIVRLHGSFDWVDSFPVQLRSLARGGDPLWIPPGVIKEKQRYPFNVLWGRARELLDCDILRIVGWNMGPNDWDLISLLFSTRHGNDLRPAYEVELIGSPRVAQRLNVEFPYLGIRSILETERAGEALVGEYLQSAPSLFSDLGPEDQERALAAASDTERNWFLLWLKRCLEWAYVNLDVTPDLKGAMRVLEEIV